MDMQDLRYVVAIAKHEQMTAASYEVHISNSSLSKHLAKVEREIGGIQLFSRSTNRLRITPAGQEFVLHAKEILASYGELEAAMRHHKSIARYTIKMGTFHHLLCLDLAASFSDFTSTYPDIHIEIYDRSTSELLRMTEQGLLDITFIILYELSLNLPDYHVYALPSMDDELAFVTYAAHPWAGRESVHLAEMAHEPLILLNPNTPDRKVVTRAFKGFGIEPNVVQDADRLDVIFDFVSCKYGSALISSKLIDFYSANLQGVVKVRVEPTLPRLTRMIVPRHAAGRDGINTFVKYIVNNFGAVLITDPAEKKSLPIGV